MVPYRILALFFFDDHPWVSYLVVLSQTQQKKARVYQSIYANEKNCRCMVHGTTAFIFEGGKRKWTREINLLANVQHALRYDNYQFETSPDG